jgi:sterol desaturase/sphingolipid hydroxylase (fatty acid hydroxylase superfamily)
MGFREFLHLWQHTYVHIGTRYFLMAGIVFILFYVLFRKLILTRKVQAKFPKIHDYRRDIFYSALSMCIFAGISVFTFTILKPYTHIYSDIHQYSMTYYYFTFIWMFFLHDAYFYWSHRLMHHPKVFKYVHLIHHKSTNPSPWTAYAFHPFEAVMEALIVTVIAFSIPTHRSAITIYMLFQIGYNVYGHLGFEIFPRKFNRHWLGKWFNTSVSHNMHHKFFVKNYGLWTTIWDRMMGTMHAKYDETYERVTSQEIKTSPEEYMELQVANADQ